MGVKLKEIDETLLNITNALPSFQISPAMIHFLMWIIAGSVAFFISLSWLPVVYIDGKYIPAGADSFYHARRILDFIYLDNYFQFDPKIHAPDGGLLTWPWAYDYIIAKIITLCMAVFGIHDPMAVMVYIPPAWVYVNTALLLAIASLLKLSRPLQFIAVLCFALLPLTHHLHGIGRIDHHYMESTMVLLTILCGLYWFKTKLNTTSSLLFALVLGFAPGVNNGLFILQIRL